MSSAAVELDPVELTPVASASEVPQLADEAHEHDQDLAAARERRLYQLRDRHWTMLSIALFICMAAIGLRIRGTEEVLVPGTNSAFPTFCGSRALFGVECPGCGLTRSFIALAAGDLRRSYEFHHIGWLMALAVVAQIPYRTYCLRELKQRIVVRRWPQWFGYFLIVALIANWFAKIF